MVWLRSWEQSGLYKNNPSLPHGGRRGKLTTLKIESAYKPCDVFWKWRSCFRWVWSERYLKFSMIPRYSWCCWSWSTVIAARMSLASSRRPLESLSKPSGSHKGSSQQRQKLQRQVLALVREIFWWFSIPSLHFRCALPVRSSPQDPHCGILTDGKSWIQYIEFLTSTVWYKLIETAKLHQ